MTAVAQDWNPETYARFRGLRLRPALDLLAQIGDVPRGDVVDLGCGDGAVGPMLATRYKRDHGLIGVDSSATMLAEAGRLLTRLGNRLYDGLTQADIELRAAHTPAALIFSNAALHWLPDHGRLMPRLARMLAPGGTMAVQMPGQFNAPSHALLRQIAEDMFPDRFDFTSYSAPVHAPETYHAMLSPFGDFAAWETTYLQLQPPVTQGHPIRAFTESTAMRPFMEGLNAEEAARYVAAYDAALADHYPCLPDGSALFPFRRLFFTLKV